MIVRNYFKLLIKIFFFLIFDVLRQFSFTKAETSYMGKNSVSTLLLWLNHTVNVETVKKS